MLSLNRILPFLRPASHPLRGIPGIEVRTDPSDGHLVIVRRPAEPATAAAPPTWAFQAERWIPGDRRYVVEIVSADRDVAAARVERLRQAGHVATLTRILYARTLVLD